jgi:hypothetical protein
MHTFPCFIHYSSAIQRTMDHYWRFDFTTGFTDSITSKNASLHGNKNHISIQGSRDYNGYLYIKDRSSVELDGLKSSCFSKPIRCKNGVSIVMWFRNLAKDQVTHFRSKGGAFSLLRSLNNTLVIRIVNGTATHETSFWFNTSVWNHIAITLDQTNGLVIYSNSRKLNTATLAHSYTPPSFIHNDIQDSRNNSLFLYGEASYDDIMIWHKALSPLEIKKIFQSQISKSIDQFTDPGAILKGNQAFASKRGWS